MKSARRILSLFCAAIVFSAYSPVFALSGGTEFRLDIIFENKFINMHGRENHIYAQDEERRMHIFDMNLNEIVEPKYSYDGNYFDANGLMSVCEAGKERKFGFINQQGEEIIPTIYDEVNQFTDGIALVKKDGLWGAINTLGQTVIEFQYDYVKPYKEGRFIAFKDGEYSLVNSAGIDISNGIYNRYTSVNFSKNGYAFVTSDPLKRTLFTDFDETEPIRYNSLFLYDKEPRTREEFENAIIPTFSVIDPSGNTVIDNLEPNIYTVSSAGPFTPVHYTYCFEPTRFSDYGIAFAKRNGKFGIIDTSGNILHDFVIDSYSTIKNGYDYVAVIGETRKLISRYGTAYGLDINDYDSVVNVGPDIAIIKKNGLYGAARLSGETLLPAEYTLAGGYDRELIFSKEYLLFKDGKYYMFDLYSGELNEIKLSDGYQYDVLIPIRGDRLLKFWSEDNGLYGVCDYDGNVIIEPNTKHSSVELSSEHITMYNDDIQSYYNKKGELMYYISTGEDTGTYSSSGEKLSSSKIHIGNPMDDLSTDNFYITRIGSDERLSLITINEVPKPENVTEHYICVKEGTPLININGEVRTVENNNYFIKPIMDSGSLMMPIDPLAVCLGFEVNWNDETKTAKVSNGRNTVAMPLGSSTLYINGQEGKLNCQIRMIDGRMYIPAQEFLDGLGIAYNFDSERNTLTILY